MLVVDEAEQPGGSSGGNESATVQFVALTVAESLRARLQISPPKSQYFGNSVGSVEDSVNEACLRSVNVARPESKHFFVVQNTR